MLVPMKHWFTHFSPPVASGTAAGPSAAEGPLPLASRACCCPASPQVRVVMPPAAGRPYLVDLLLCGHHYRISRAALQAAGAAAYNKDGALIMAGVRDRPATLREAVLAGQL